MKVVTGDTIWSKLNNIPNKYTYISENIECDVVIIGAGITGALCSYYFTKENVDTVILDRNIIGYGSTRANTAILQYEIDVDLIGLKGIIGEEDAVKCFKETKNTLYEINEVIKDIDDDCGFQIKDCLYYSYKNNDINFLRKEYDLRKENGFDVTYIDETKSKGMFSFDIKGGIYSNNLAGEIDPYRLTHSLIRKGVENGLRVYENTEVVNIKNEKHNVQLTTKNGFKIKAKKVIIATGYEARNYFDKKTAILTRSFNIVTKPLTGFEGWYNKCIIRDTENAYTYIRATEDNRIIIGGEDEKLGGERSKMYNLQDEDEFSYRKYNTLFSKLKSFFPDINDIEMEYGFSGFFGETKDGLPYIGEHKDYPNHYFCLGYGSNGTIYGLMGAKLLRDLYFGDNPPILELFKIDR
ncbi:NAD(P)/FAD-dependent oxidoreductase [Oceanirhabdus sp. W0125-5]|uniref:NAD(P)/FAD-dependent oxidoreductase n=1 Tax=Oceanirhabdus sp. W0125-5 TaxID=2999116 RepID=UPI0022F34255|nr:FAD-dependent oxidoreductase [Oceanirhabdus sp. W0125-5]WBW96514.1 FAD-dependent oxidoreductase [Oceanirhabdus sp. W0125-5]